MACYRGTIATRWKCDTRLKTDKEKMLLLEFFVWLVFCKSGDVMQMYFCRNKPDLKNEKLIQWD